MHSKSEYGFIKFVPIIHTYITYICDCMYWLWYKTYFLLWVTVWKPLLYISNFQPVRRGRHTGVPQFFKHAICDYLVRGTDLFSLRLSNKKRQQPTQQQPSGVNESKLYLFLSGQQKIFFSVWHRILVISLCVPWDETVWKSLLYRNRA